MKYIINAECCYDGETANTPTSNNLTKQQVIEWITKLLDTEPDMKSACISLTVE